MFATDSPAGNDPASGLNSNSASGQSSGSGFNPMVAVAGGGAILNWLGGQSTNDANSAEAAKNRDFSSIEAQKSRDWSQNMAAMGFNEKQYFQRNTYQNTMADMKAAGLNPILAAQQGGTAVGGTSGMGGGQASAPGNAQMQNAMGQGLNSGMAAASLINDLRSTNADITMKQAQALSATANATYANASAKQANEATSQMEARRGSNQAEATRDQGDATWEDQNRAARMLTQRAGFLSSAVKGADAIGKMTLGDPSKIKQPWEKASPAGPSDRWKELYGDKTFNWKTGRVE